jgi:hypothetical protein
MRLLRAALRLFPRALHTREARAAGRVRSLDDAKRRELARNLARMLRPKAAA